MIKIPIRQNWRDYVKRQVEESNAGAHKNYFLQTNAGKIYGLMGECGFAYYLQHCGIEYDHVGFTCRDFDFVVNGICVDVKTKYTKYPDVRDWFTWNVCTHQKEYRADIYLFCAINEHNIWLCGWEHKDKFWASEHGIDVDAGQSYQDSAKTALVPARFLKQGHLATIDQLLTFFALHENPPM